MMSASAPPMRQRRWLRFGLRTLLLAMTVLSVWLGIKVRQVHNQQRALEMVRQLQGQVQYDYQWDMTGVEIPNFLPEAPPPGPAWLRRWVGDDFFVGVAGLTVTGVRDDQLGFLKCLPPLEALSVEKSQVTDAGLAAIANQTKLQYLWLDDTQISDAGLVHLRGLSSLRYLYLRNTNVTDQGAAQLTQYLPHACICYGREGQIIRPSPPSR